LRRRINHETQETGSRGRGGPGSLRAELWDRNVDGGGFYEQQIVHLRLDRRPVVVDLRVLDGLVGIVWSLRVHGLFWRVRDLGGDRELGHVRLVDHVTAGEWGSAVLYGARVHPLRELLRIR
jgi:hypothetical protein